MVPNPPRYQGLWFWPALLRYKHQNKSFFDKKKKKKISALQASVVPRYLKATLRYLGGN